MPDDLPVYLDDDLLEDLYRRYHAHVERAAERQLYCACSAQDVVWITWELAARKLLRFQIPGAISGTHDLSMSEKEVKSWLWRTATFCARNYSRAEWRRDKGLERILKAKVLKTETVDPETQREADVRIYCALTAIGQLPPKLRTLVEENLMDGMKPREIAARHSLKPGAVRTRLAKAMRVLEVSAREIEKTVRRWV